MLARPRCTNKHAFNLLRKCVSKNSENKEYSGVTFEVFVQIKDKQFHQ